MEKKWLWSRTLVTQRANITQYTSSRFYLTPILRIKHRTIGTILGILIFIVVFQYLVPPKYVFILVFLIGYINNFIKEYKYTQILNAVNAINASLVMLDTSTAIENRVMCLLCGILIVLIFYVLHFIYQLLTP
ncbi:MAG: FUSC family protein [Acetivibrio sp.]